ncbi:superoxide dismutase family protein [Fulvivirga ligni]|uniref:superoxide dismutase family protein n=1 Tax=Fulvivirga ligni TaxID=2904246 RepID=UPI001F1775C4|nr:superoxide dismutase family protein [Fulvivirga ligni]UII23966.1 superoxide dismutase family protein [Fulvivirga ligni]
MKLSKLAIVVIGSTIMVSCGPSNKGEDASSSDSTEMSSGDNKPEEKVMLEAKATINPASGSNMHGEMTFTDLGEGDVTFKLTVEGAEPGTHAVHLHQTGDCSAEDATSAGGHWNPSDVEHGKRAVDMKFHAGDIDNMEVGADGKGELTMTISGWSIGGADSTNIIDHAVIIHAKEDDFATQPSGAAGKRVACGVIEKAD